MKKIIPLLFLSLLFSFQVLNAQEPKLEWVQSLNNSGLSSAIVSDANGNIYAYYGTNDSLYLKKMDVEGNLIWNRTFPGELGYLKGTKLAIDTSSGSIYVTGSYGGTVDFDLGSGVFNMTSIGMCDVFILKLDSNGSFLWARSFGNYYCNNITSIASDNIGNVFLIGEFFAPIDLNPDTGTFIVSVAGGSSSIYLLKLDSNGIFNWAKTFYGNYSSDAGSITSDVVGNIYITGLVDTEAFVKKLDTNGNIVWGKSMGGGSGSAYIYSMYSDGKEYIYTTGCFYDSIDFDPNIGVFQKVSNGNYDAFIQKLDTSGNFIWAESMGGSDRDIVYSISVDDLGNIFTTGTFKDTVDFDPGAGTCIFATNDYTDSFIQKLDSNGNFLWATSIAGVGNHNTSSTSNTTDAQGNAYTIGHYSGTVDFNPDSIGTHSFSSPNSSDIYIQKLSTCYETYQTDTIIACNSFTWIDGNTYYSSNQTAQHIIVNEIGCDTIISLDLLVHPLDTSVSRYMATLTANEPSATYQWMYFNNGYFAMQGETNQSFTPINNGGLYAVEITKNGCSDTSNIHFVNNVGITDNLLLEYVRLFPNPTKEKINIEFDEIHEYINIKIHDIYGKVIFVNDYKNTNKIGLELKLPKALYFIELQDSYGRMAHFKVVKK